MKSRLSGRGMVVWFVMLFPALLTGCKLTALAYHVAAACGMDTNLPPPFIFPEDAGRVAVVTNTDLSTQIDMGHVDHDLNEMISRKLFAGFQGEKKMKEIQVVKASKVSAWQDEHPDWRSLEPVDIGRGLKANYIIYVDVERMSFYQDGRNKLLYQGQADVRVSVVKVDDEEKEGVVVFPPDDFSLEFPKGRPIPIGDIAPVKFRRMFLDRLADQVVWYFVPHESLDDFGRDPF